MAYRLAEDAENDLDEIWQYVAKESGAIEVAQNLIESITIRSDTLSAHPQPGRGHDDLRAGLRCHTVGSYIIFYRIVEMDVLILRVLHGRRDLASLVRDH